MMEVDQTKEYIQLLRQLPDNAVLTRETYALLYEYFIDAGMSLLLSIPQEYYLIYFDIPEAIDEINDNNVSWLLEKDDSTIALTMFAKGQDMDIYHTFHFSKNVTNASIFTSIKETRSLTIHFFTMMYGDMIKVKSISFALPPAILQQLD